MAASYQTAETTELILTFPEYYPDAASLINDDYLIFDWFGDDDYWDNLCAMLNEEDMRAYGRYYV